MSRLRHELPAHRKTGGKCHQSGGEVVKKSDSESSVFSEAKKGQDIGKIGGVKSKPRADRRRGGGVHSDAKEDRAMIGKMVKKEALTGEKHGGKVRRAAGGRVGADTEPKSTNSASAPYSSAGKGLRRGGSCG